MIRMEKKNADRVLSTLPDSHRLFTPNSSILSGRR